MISIQLKKMLALAVDCFFFLPLTFEVSAHKEEAFPVLGCLNGGGEGCLTGGGEGCLTSGC